jgi:putative intracellular protease/amidase
MFDLATDPTSHKIIGEFYDAGKIVSAVCHGPAALAHVKVAGGKYLLEGQKVTGFSNSEEDAVGLTSTMPFKLEDALNEASGGHYVKAEQVYFPFSLEDE